MKKKILGGIIAVAIAAVAAVNVNYNNDTEIGFSKLSLDFVEALASGEGCKSTSGTNTGACKAKIDGSGDECVTASWSDTKNCY